MKLFIVLILGMCFFLRSVLAAEAEVPGVGSVWESTTEYAPVAEDRSPPSKKIEVVRVERIQDGRSVFTGKMLGFDGEFFESSAGTIAYTHDCKRYVPVAMFTPPPSPNQCGWHVCHAPPVGQTFTRPIIVYASPVGCHEKVATYTFEAIRDEIYEGSKVTVGKAEIMLDGLSRGIWTSYIKAGVGEVFAKSPTRTTTYSKVSVQLVSYQAALP